MKTFKYSHLEKGYKEEYKKFSAKNIYNLQFVDT